jgi:hypothetical protein
MANDLPERPFLPRYKGKVKFGLIPAIKHIEAPKVVPVGPPPFPAPPAVADWLDATPDWGTLGNDLIGDCVVACMGHVIEAWTGAAAERVTIQDADVISAYSSLTGYNPATGQPDPGVTLEAAMGYWQRVGLAGHKIDVAYPTNFIGKPAAYQALIMALVEYYGAAILAIGVTPKVIDAFYDGLPWDANMGAITDYHCVPVLAYDQSWCEVITWGRIQRVSWAFIFQYTVEIWGAASSDWIRKNGVSPTNQNLVHLDQSLLGLLTGVLV